MATNFGTCWDTFISMPAASNVALDILISMATSSKKKKKKGQKLNRIQRFSVT